jgi:hypothetical protein
MPHNKPRQIADILSELVARRGYARVQATANYSAAWRDAAGEMLCKYTRPGVIKRGVLEVVVANSILVQEITFQKSAILQKLAGLLPQEKIRDLRCRVGTIGNAD